VLLSMDDGRRGWVQADPDQRGKYSDRDQASTGWLDDNWDHCCPPLVEVTALLSVGAVAVVVFCCAAVSWALT
jgi:hypothetical protein